MNETKEKELETLKIELNDLRKNSPTKLNEIRIKLDQIGRRYDSIQMYNEALDCMKECLEIEKQILTPNHIDIASTLNLIGSLYDDIGQLENALKYLNESLIIRKQILPSNDPLIANTINIFGIIYKKQGKFEEALKCYNQSLEIYKQNYPENHISIANSLNNIGIICRTQRKFEEGLKYLNQSLEIYNKILPSTHFSIAETLHNIGSIYFDEGNYEEALKTCKKALEIMKQTLPESHPSVEIVRSAIGLIYFNQKKYEEALKYLKEGRLKEECLKKLEDKSNQIIHSMKNKSITDQESKINYLLNDLNIRKVKTQISKGNITLQTYIEGINADVLIGRVIDEKYKIDKYLGRGAYGKVYIVLDKNENNNIKVIKLIKKSNSNDEWATEASLLRRLEHNNIIKYYDHFDLISKESKSYPCIITEYCENGDLASKIEKAKNRKENFQDKIILNWIFQASDGLQYLHKMKVIHRDIKPQNILLTCDDVIKLADLGTAKVMQECSVADSVRGTTIYMSPEMRACLSFITGLVYSYPTDIWSLGCVLYELVFLDYAHKNVGKDLPFGGSPNFSDYIKKMLVQNPDDRITAKNLYDQFKKLKERLDR